MSVYVGNVTLQEEHDGQEVVWEGKAGEAWGMRSFEMRRKPDAKDFGAERDVGASYQVRGVN